MAVLEPANGRGDSGSLLVGGGGPRNPKDPPVPPQLAVETDITTASRGFLIEVRV